MVETIDTVKIALRLLGAVASLLFAWQAIWTMIHPNATDFWEGCHWLGEVMQGLVVGAAGCYWELRGGAKSVESHFGRFALNRLCLTLFYTWMGCYVMGGQGVKHHSKEWIHLARATGVLAWVVAVGDLFVSCCFRRDEDDDDDRLKKAGAQQKDVEAPTDNFGVSSPSGDAPASSSTPSRGAGSAGADATTPCSGAWGEGTSSPFDGAGTSPFDDQGATSTEDVNFSVDDNAPPGGWNNTASFAGGGGKPFGAA